MKKVTVIGAGLAGSEAALQLAKRGISVDLYEMRPEKQTGAHKTDKFAEFVCSNSLGSYDITNASGLLKHEMQQLGSELIDIVFDSQVPAGGALAIDRELFSKTVTDKIENNELINVIRKEVTEIDFENPVIIASGPLTSETLSAKIKEILGEDYLHFFDAIAPIIEKESVNFDKAFYLNRYNKGDADYINCPMNKEEYEKFYNILINAPKIELKTFEKGAKFFESLLDYFNSDYVRFPIDFYKCLDMLTGEESVDYGKDEHNFTDAIVFRSPEGILGMRRGAEVMEALTLNIVTADLKKIKDGFNRDNIDNRERWSVPILPWEEKRKLRFEELQQNPK